MMGTGSTLFYLIVLSCTNLGFTNDLTENQETSYVSEDQSGLDSEEISNAEILSIPEMLQERIADDTSADDINATLFGDTGSEHAYLDNLNDTTSLMDKPENNSSSNSSFHVSCLLKNSSGLPVEIVNGSRLVNLLQVEPNITSRQMAANCVAVLFYSPTCPFSCMAAPHFNALPRIFPSIKMIAVDAMTHHSFNAQYGIVGVPTLVLFHNGRPAVKFNETSEYGLEMFAKFITKCTGIEPEGMLVVTSADFGGPISSVPVKERDYCLILSWIFILTCAMYFFYRSSWWRWLVDATLNAWREAEAQHHHAD